MLRAGEAGDAWGTRRAGFAAHPRARPCRPGSLTALQLRTFNKCNADGLYLRLLSGRQSKEYWYDGHACQVPAKGTTATAAAATAAAAGAAASAIRPRVRRGISTEERYNLELEFLFRTGFSLVVTREEYDRHAGPGQLLAQDMEVSKVADAAAAFRSSLSRPGAMQ